MSITGEVVANDEVKCELLTDDGDDEAGAVKSDESSDFINAASGPIVRLTAFADSCFTLCKWPPTGRP